MELITELCSAALDALKDTLIILPFLFAAYLVIGLLERGTGKKMIGIILAADRIGPLAGGLLGGVPSCGFSAAASNLYSAGFLTVGTLIAVYISTSDEMLAVLISQNTAPLLILKILAIKIGAGVLFGFLIDGVIRLYYRQQEKAARAASEAEEGEWEEGCECDCGESCCAAKSGLWGSAIWRTLRVLFFIFLISVAINILLIFVDEDTLADLFRNIPLWGCFFSALVGLIPNCAVSVVITQFYLDGIISAPIMLSGLMAGAGSGLLVLMQSNPYKKVTAGVVVTLYLCSVLGGMLAGTLFF